MNHIKNPFSRPLAIGLVLLMAATNATAQSHGWHGHHHGGWHGGLRGAGGWFWGGIGLGLGLGLANAYANAAEADDLATRYVVVNPPPVYLDQPGCSCGLHRLIPAVDLSATRTNSAADRCRCERLQRMGGSAGAGRS